MKIPGGHLPRVAGRPSSVVTDAPPPEHLAISCLRKGLAYTPLVQAQQDVTLGAPLARADVHGGQLFLPAPASGRVGSVTEDLITIADPDTSVPSLPGNRPGPERITSGRMRAELAKGGIWPAFWSSGAGGMPALDGSDEPAHIIVNCLATEPFRARGKVVLRRDWHGIVKGIRFLPRLLAEYGTIHIVLTDAMDPVAKMMRRDLTGHARLNFQVVPLVYPVGHPAVISRALRRSLPKTRRGDSIWVVDVHTMRSVGACLTDGTPLHERLVAVGGGGEANPRHVRVRIGTPLSRFLDRAATDPDVALLLRGGLLTGQPVDDLSTGVDYDDDAFFVLPRPGEREFLGFARAGFDRTSIQPCFASRITGAYDRHISTSLRGERRPCIACGLCERVCPMRLLPQVIHRYLYRDAIDQAEAAGLLHCIGCGLCSYVCPSKIEMSDQFTHAKEQVRREHDEAAAAEADRTRREESKQLEIEHSEDWRK